MISIYRDVGRIEKGMEELIKSNHTISYILLPYLITLIWKIYYLIFPLKLNVETCEILSLLLNTALKEVMAPKLEASVTLEHQQLLGRNGPTMGLT